MQEAFNLNKYLNEERNIFFNSPSYEIGTYIPNSREISQMEHKLIHEIDNDFKENIKEVVDYKNINYPKINFYEFLKIHRNSFKYNNFFELIEQMSRAIKMLSK